MTLEILICTTEKRLAQVCDVLLPQRDDLAYLVSCQYEDDAPCVPDTLMSRKDVRVLMLKGRGLSINRNNTLLHAVNDVLLIADDDCQYLPQMVDEVLKVYQENPDVDVALFKVDGMSKYYPAQVTDYIQKDFLGPYSISSVEMTLRCSSVRSYGLQFNPNFGLGSKCLASGEEQVFIKDALDMGLKVRFFPFTIGSTKEGTTGDLFLNNPLVQRSKGATFCYLFGSLKAFVLCFKESLHYLVYKRVNPIKLLYQMNLGIRLCNSFVKTKLPKRPTHMC